MLINFKDLYVTLVPEHTEENSAGKLFRIHKVVPRPTIPSTPCCAGASALFVAFNFEPVGDPPPESWLFEYLAAELAQPGFETHAVPTLNDLNLAQTVELEQQLAVAQAHLQARKAQLQTAANSAAV